MQKSLEKTLAGEQRGCVQPQLIVYSVFVNLQKEWDGHPRCFVIDECSILSGSQSVLLIDIWINRFRITSIKILSWTTRQAIVLSILSRSFIYIHLFSPLTHNNSGWGENITTVNCISFKSPKALSSIWMWSHQSGRDVEAVFQLPIDRCQRLHPLKTGSTFCQLLMSFGLNVEAKGVRWIREWAKERRREESIRRCGQWSPDGDPSPACCNSSLNTSVNPNAWNS